MKLSLSVFGATNSRSGPRLKLSPQRGTQLSTRFFTESSSWWLRYLWQWGLKGKTVPRTVPTLKSMLDFTFLLPFSLTEDDQKSCCVVNNSSQIEIVSKLGSHSFFLQIISTGAWDYCKLLHQCWITPSFAYLSTAHSLCNILSFHWTKNKKIGEKNYPTTTLSASQVT